MDSVVVNIVKGSHVRVQVMQAYMPCLSGMQPKFGVKMYAFTGITKHFYSASPDGSTGAHIYVTPDDWNDVGDMTRVADCSCGGPHVVITSKSIVGVLP